MSRHGFLPSLCGSHFLSLCGGHPPPRVGFPFLHLVKHLTSCTPPFLQPVNSFHPYQPQNLHRNPFICLGIAIAKPPNVTPPYHFPNLTLRSFRAFTTNPPSASPIHNAYRLRISRLPQPQIHDWHVDTAAREQILCSLGPSFPTGDLLLLLGATSMPLPPATRPPPEPPPSFKVRVGFGSTVSKNPLQLSPALAHALSDVLAPTRPPPKPPWLHQVLPSFLVCMLFSGVSMGYLLYVLYFSNFWFEDAYIVFAESPHRTPSCLSTWWWILLHYVVTVRTFGANSFSDALSNYYLASGPQDKLVNLEIINSRIVRTQVKEIIRNWIVRKTAESLLLITSTWEQKSMIIWMLGCRVSACYVLLVSNCYKCNGRKVHYSCVVVFFRIVDSSMVFGNVQPNLLHVACIDVSIFN